MQRRPWRLIRDCWRRLQNREQVFNVSRSPDTALSSPGEFSTARTSNVCGGSLCQQSQFANPSLGLRILSHAPTTIPAIPMAKRTQPVPQTPHELPTPSSPLLITMADHYRAAIGCRTSLFTREVVYDMLLYLRYLRSHAERGRAGMVLVVPERDDPWDL